MILDATAGVLVVRPTAADLKDAAARARHERAQGEVLAGLAGEDAITADGVRIQLLANVDLPEEAAGAATNQVETPGPNEITIDVTKPDGG